LAPEPKRLDKPALNSKFASSAELYLWILMITRLQHALLNFVGRALSNYSIILLLISSSLTKFTHCTTSSGPFAIWIPHYLWSSTIICLTLLCTSSLWLSTWAYLFKNSSPIHLIVHLMILDLNHNYLTTTLPPLTLRKPDSDLLLITLSDNPFEQCSWIS